MLPLPPLLPSRPFLAFHVYRTNCIEEKNKIKKDEIYFEVFVNKIPNLSVIAVRVDVVSPHPPALYSQQIQMQR